MAGALAKIMRTDPRFAAFSPLLALVLSGCGSAEDAFASAVVTSALQAPQAQQLTDDVAQESCAQLTAEGFAAEAAARPPVGLYPVECVTKRAEGAELSVTYDDCTGPFGRVRLDGSVEAIFEVSGECRLHADIADTGLTANARPLAVQATADIEVREDARAIDWQGHFAGTTRRGRAVEQVSDFAVLVDHKTSCRTFDGTAEGNVDGIEYDFEVSGMSVCPGACPAGGVVQAAWHGRRRERDFRVEFDGTSVARVTLPSGSVKDVAMVCDAAEAQDDE
jgi:hypothetical protein